MAVKSSSEPIYISAAITARAAPDAEGAPASDGPRVLHVVASTEAEDSHDSILLQNWDLKRFNANPVVLWAHRRDEIPIGTAKAKLVGSKGEPGRKLEADITFPPAGKFRRSDEIWDAWEAGLLRAVSVGFKAHTIRWEKIKDREVLVFDDLELLELSFVPVGSNPETLADARQRALAERLGDTLRDLIVPPAETTTAAAVAAAVQPAAEAATPQEHRMDPKSLARDLGLSEDATEAQIRSAITESRASVAGCKALLEAVGAPTVDAARGLIEAGKAAVVELTKAQARIAEIEAEKAESERAAIITKLDSEHRISPAQRDGFCKTATLETLRSFAESAPVIVAPSQHREAGTGASAGAGSKAPVTHDGKAYEELTSDQKAALRESDRETFNAVRDSWLARGNPPSKLAG